MEDELRKVGPLKERHVDPQIAMDHDGFPSEIGCFEANQAETAAIVPISSNSKPALQLDRRSRRGRRRDALSGNLRELDEANLRFVVCSRMTKAPTDLASPTFVGTATRSTMGTWSTP